ncbi:MAG TPA: hypothetical protein VM537_17540 [Anaerolineae bacterium]|nr:hypothetical protein [Anaerolineae bacterium]
MQIKTFPHEFMARWGRDGKLQGYHVITVDILCDDTTGLPVKKDPADPASENLMEKFGEATTAEKAGVSLDEIMTQIQTAALALVDDLTAQLTASQTALTTSQAQATALEEQVAKLTEPPSIAAQPA